MSDDRKTGWALFDTVADTMSAEAIAGVLRAEGVPVDVRTDTAILGEARRCRIYVPTDLLHRARWLFSAGAVADEELEFLATGKRPSDP